MPHDRDHSNKGVRSDRDPGRHLRGPCRRKFLKGSDLQSSLASRLADVAQSNARALLTINRDVAQMALEAIAKPDPMAIATLTPRALQLSMREGAACMAGSLEVSFSIGMALISAGLDLSKGKTGSS